jgi:hypothetical protein
MAAVFLASETRGRGVGIVSRRNVGRKCRDLQAAAGFEISNLLLFTFPTNVITIDAP